MRKGKITEREKKKRGEEKSSISTLSKQPHEAEESLTMRWLSFYQEEKRKNFFSQEVLL
jgi:hypothetical protein